MINSFRQIYFGIYLVSRVTPSLFGVPLKKVRLIDGHFSARRVKPTIQYLKALLSIMASHKLDMDAESFLEI